MAFCHQQNKKLKITFFDTSQLKYLTGACQLWNNFPTSTCFLEHFLTKLIQCLLVLKRSQVFTFPGLYTVLKRFIMFRVLKLLHSFSSLFYPHFFMTFRSLQSVTYEDVLNMSLCLYLFVLCLSITLCRGRNRELANSSAWGIYVAYDEWIGNMTVAVSSAL